MTNHNEILWLWVEKCKGEVEVEVLLLHSGVTISLARGMTFIHIIIYILIPGPVNTG